MSQNAASAKRIFISNKNILHSDAKQFIFMLLPLIAGNILQQFYNTIDTVIIGRYSGSLEFAAVGLSSSVMNLLLFAMIGFCTGVSVLFSRSYGAGNVKMLKKYYFTALSAGTAAVAALSLISFAGIKHILVWMSTPEELISFCLSYLHIIIAGLCISYLYNLYASLLRSVNKAGIALAALLLSVILNTILDLIFIAGFELGIAGAAAATVIAQCFSVLFCIIYLRIKYPALHIKKADANTDSVTVKEMFSIGMVTAIHQVSLYLGKILIQSTVNSCGTEMIAAYTATGRIEGFANSFGDSGYTVTSVLVAQRYGAENKKGIRDMYHISLAVLAVLGIASSAVMFLFAPQFCGFLLGNQTGALTSAVSYLRLISVFYLFCFTGNTFAGYFDGLGKVKIPFIGALSHMTLRVILSFFWIPAYGLFGLAAATGIGWILVNIFWYLLVKRNNACPGRVYSSTGQAC